jgi:hypothetical protein
LYDDCSHQTHFTGFMLEEEIVASLWGSTLLATRNIFEYFCFMSTQHFGGENFKGKGKIHSIIIYLGVGIHVAYT